MTRKEQLKRWSWRIFKWGLALAGVAFVALVVAVGIAMQSLPSYQELTRRSDLGQTVRTLPAPAGDTCACPQFHNPTKGARR